MVRQRFARGPLLPLAPQPSVPRPLDGRSVFVGNLAEITTKERVAQVCTDYGPIVFVDLIVKASDTRKESGSR